MAHTGTLHKYFSNSGNPIRTHTKKVIRKNSSVTMDLHANIKFHCLSYKSTHYFILIISL